MKKQRKKQTKKFIVVIISLEGLTDTYECDQFIQDPHVLKLMDAEFEGKQLNAAVFVLSNITGFYVISQTEKKNEHHVKKSGQNIEVQ